MSKAVSKPKPTLLGSAPGRAKPSVAPDALPSDDEFPRWRMRRMDLRNTHNLGWGTCSRARWLLILEKLGGYEQMTFAEMGKAKCHHVERDGWKQRLVDQCSCDNLSQVQDVYSVRIEGALRVLCFREGRILYLRWFDPGHYGTNSNYRGRGE